MTLLAPETPLKGEAPPSPPSERGRAGGRSGAFSAAIPPFSWEGVCFSSWC